MKITLLQFMFFLLSAVVVVFSVLTITGRNILRVAVYLLFVLVATAGFYLMLNYQFMAGVQLILYAGGIVVLIVFSILLTSHIDHKLPKARLINLASGILVAVTGLIISVTAILQYPFEATSNQALPVDMKVIGSQLMETGSNGYALPFEVISVLLLAAMIGAIIVAKKGKTKKSN
jgi:NADH-quinone oxidoreductase subunit J